MMTPIQTFWAEPTGRAWRWLRRYVVRPYGERRGWTCESGWHEAKVRIEDAEDPLVEITNGDVWPHDDPRWPTTCERCPYEFVEADEWQLSAHQEYAGGGHVFTLFDAPAGAMYDAHWMPESWRGSDGISLVVFCPQRSGGRAQDWHVDSRAANCTKPDDTEHKCWVRHGDPRKEPVTVDKDGVTCAAGAGSIQIGDWHGFLRGGLLVE